MLKIVFSLLLIIEGILATSEGITYYCREEMDCKRVPFPREVPQTNEDLQKICVPSIEFIECRINHLEGCEPRDTEELQLGYKILGVVNDICSEDTLLHAAIVDNLECFSRVVTDRSSFCPLHSEDGIQQLAEALREEGILSLTDNEDDTNHVYQCIDAVSFHACQSLKLEEKCGTVAVNAHMEVLQRLGPAALYPNCENFDDLLPALIRLHKLEENIAEAIRKRK